nr:MAG TPA: hypothetical protein [Caudoviricetes sp.]
MSTNNSHPQLLALRQRTHHNKANFEPPTRKNA